MAQSKITRKSAKVRKPERPEHRARKRREPRQGTLRVRIAGGGGEGVVLHQKLASRATNGRYLMKELFD